MKLHEAIIIVLQHSNRPMTFSEIANEIYRKNLYRQKSGDKASVSQIMLRVKSPTYQNFFIIEEGVKNTQTVRLKRNCNISKSEELQQHILIPTTSKTNKSPDYKEGLSPWIDEHSEILILGTLPSDDSIKAQAYYQNESNSFWKLIHGIYGEGENSQEFLLKHHIALWDCLAAGNRKGSSDANFEGGKITNKIQELLESYPNIKKIILNGISTTKKEFDENFSYLYNRKSIEIIAVPSSSSNTRKIKFTDKLSIWEKVLK